MARWTYKLRLRLRSLFGRRGVERELGEEVRFHLEKLAEENRAKGMDPAEAWHAGMREFGGVEQLKEECRDARGVHLFETVSQDLRFGLRMLGKSPGFAATAILTLALGIGATTAIFSVVNGVLLRPLPYPQAGRLVSVQASGPLGSRTSYPNFYDWQAQNHVFSAMASYHGLGATLTGAGRAVRVQGLVVSSGLFQVLKAKPLLGRGFEPQNDRRGANVVVLSYGLWRSVFHSSRSVIGQVIALDNGAFTVIGVMPAGFEFPPGVHEDLWTSVAADRESGSNIMTGRGYDVLSVIARLKPGASPTEARADMSVIASRLAREYPQNDARETTKIVPEINRVVGSVRMPLLLILGVVVGVLLIACANVANLSLARSLARQKEIAVREALGAHRARLARQLLTESILLSILGGIAGTLLAAWGTPLLLHLAPQGLPRVGQVGVDWRVLAFALALSLVTGVAFGGAPALQASRTALVESLKDAAHTPAHGTSPRRFRSALVVAETALAMVLLAGAGLLISSYVRLTNVSPGFNPDNLLTFSLALPTPPYTESASLRFLNRLLYRLRHLPDVRSAAADWALPFSGSDPTAGVDFEGRTYAPGDTPIASADAVAPGYFRTMGIPLLKGRTFTDGDNAKSLPVVIVNEAFARRYLPNESAIGKRIKPGLSAGSGTPWREIVGVVGNVKQTGLAGNFEPEFYFPLAQFPNFTTVVIRGDGNPLKLAPAVRAIVGSMDKNVPVYDVATMEGYLASSVAWNRFSTFLLGIFGGLALVLAGLGIYGVVSYMANQSKHDIGIRMALGANAGGVLRLVIGQGLKLALIGLIIGTCGALALTRFLSGWLYGVTPTDPLTFVAVSLILIGVALVACYIPARRAMRVDPMAALRQE